MEEDKVRREKGKEEKEKKRNEQMNETMMTMTIIIIIIIIINRTTKDSIKSFIHLETKQKKKRRGKEEMNHQLHCFHFDSPSNSTSPQFHPCEERSISFH